MTDSRNKGGRPRKDDATKKARRVQIAMTESEYADARRLAQLLDTTVSSALATYAVPVSLRSKMLDDLAERIRLELSRASLRSAEDFARLRAGAIDIDKLQQPTNFIAVGQKWEQIPELSRYAASTGRSLVVIEFVGSERTHRELKTQTQKLYDDAITAFAKEQARIWSDVFTSSDRDYSVATTPYRESTVFVLFGFKVQQMANRLYSYGEPIDWDVGSFTQQPADVA